MNKRLHALIGVGSMLTLLTVSNVAAQTVEITPPPPVNASHGALHVVRVQLSYAPVSFATARKVSDVEQLTSSDRFAERGSNYNPATTLGLHYGVGRTILVGATLAGTYDYWSRVDPSASGTAWMIETGPSAELLLSESSWRPFVGVTALYRHDVFRFPSAYSVEVGMPLTPKPTHYFLSRDDLCLVLTGGLHAMLRDQLSFDVSLRVLPVLARDGWLEVSLQLGLAGWM